MGNDLSIQYFMNQFKKVKEILVQEKKELTSIYFASGEAEEKNLADLIKLSIST